MASPRCWMVNGVNMVSYLSVFSTAFLLRILQFWSGFPLSRSWWACNRVRCNVRRADWLSIVSIDLCEGLPPFLAVVRKVNQYL